MWEKMETWLIRPLKSLLSYCRDSCYTRKKPRVKKTADNSYISNCTGTSTKNIIKLLIFSEAITTTAGIQIPQLFFKNNLGQTFLFAFDPNASSSKIDLSALNKTVSMINNEILAQCNVNSTIIFKYTPKIITNLSCTISRGGGFGSVSSIRFNLISDKIIPQTLLGCVNKKILDNFDGCVENPGTLSKALGITFGVVGGVIVAFWLVPILYINRVRLKKYIIESYLQVREIIRPREETVHIELANYSVVNDADETKALLP